MTARDRAAHFVNLGVEGVSADTAYLLVDLSDTSGFKHTKTNELHLLGLKFNSEKASDGVYDFWVGVVKEVDATNGSVQWVHVFHLEAVGNPTDSTDRFAQDIDFTQGGGIPNGINLAIASDATLHFVGNQAQDDNVAWQTDVTLVNPTGSNVAPGQGDLVAWAEEVSGSGTLDFSCTVIYEAG